MTVLTHAYSPVWNAREKYIGVDETENGHQDEVEG
jgi:hypothetical protein